MSSATATIFVCLRWLCLLTIFCSNITSCQGQQTLCGNKLTQALELMCSNGFVRKIRKPIDPIDYYTDNEDDLPSPFEQLPFFSKIPANVIAKTRRRRYGIADECCKKPCKMSEIQSYCL